MGKLKEYKSIGINRLSMGLQSADNNLLKELGRIHTFEEFLDNYKLAKDLGFENINIDLMLGLPNQTIENLENGLKTIINLNPKHISIYSLILEEDTVLWNKAKEKKINLPTEDVEREMYWKTKEILELNGYNHYEISNFSKEGYESLHNSNCWKQDEYIGFGVAACSFSNNIRFGNIDDIEKYIEFWNCKNKDRKRVV